MNLLRSSCSDVRRHLLRLDELDAVERGVLEIHLRRCKECARITAEFSRIETSSLEPTEVTEERQRDIYNRLVPAVHEITSRIPPPPSRDEDVSLALSSKYWMTAAMLAVAAAAVSIVLMKLL